MYEARFNDELLATLLSIPSSKTLLRRHLSIHFKELVGRYYHMSYLFSSSIFEPKSADPNTGLVWYECYQFLSIKYCNNSEYWSQKRTQSGNCRVNMTHTMSCLVLCAHNFNQTSCPICVPLINSLL